MPKQTSLEEVQGLLPKDHVHLNFT